MRWDTLRKNNPLCFPLGQYPIPTTEEEQSEFVFPSALIE